MVIFVPLPFNFQRNLTTKFFALWSHDQEIKNWSNILFAILKAINVLLHVLAMLYIIYGAMLHTEYVWGILCVGAICKWQREADLFGGILCMRYTMCRGHAPFFCIAAFCQNVPCLLGYLLLIIWKLILLEA